MKADFHSHQMPMQNFGVSWSTKPPFRRALRCSRQRVFNSFRMAGLKGFEQENVSFCLKQIIDCNDKVALSTVHSRTISFHPHIFLCICLHDTKTKFRSHTGHSRMSSFRFSIRMNFSFWYDISFWYHVTESELHGEVKLQTM